MVRQIPHSQKLLLVKTFVNFAVLLPSAKALSVNFTCVDWLGPAHIITCVAVIGNLQKVSFTNLQKFSPMKVSGCWCWGRFWFQFLASMLYMFFQCTLNMYS